MPTVNTQITLDALKTLSEREWRGQVIELARLLGWKHYFTWTSIHSPAGFPDLVLTRERIIFAELKTDKGKVSPSQRLWLDYLTVAQGEVYIWRPGDWNEVVNILTRRGNARIAAETQISPQTTNR